MATPLPILISGSGPTGLYLALSLTRNGVPVRIIEKDLQFHNAYRGGGLMPRTREVQHFLGIDKAILGWGGKSHVVHMRLYKTPGGTEVLKSWKFVDGSTPSSPGRPIEEAIFVPQMAHERVLREELAKVGVIVELGKELKTFTQDADGVTAELAVHSSDGSSTTEFVRAAYLCGADGARGPTRKNMAITFLGNTVTGDPMVLTDMVLHGLDDEYFHMWMIRGRVEGDFNLICIPLRDGKRTYNTVLMGAGGFDPSEFVKPGALFKVFPDIVGRPDVELKELIMVSVLRPNSRMVDKFHDGRAFVLGDAAHVHPPTGGQGLNSSVQDSFNLGWKLALVYKNQAPPSLLDTYSEERVPVIAQMLGKTKLIWGKAYDKTDDPAIGSMRRGGALLQLGVNYRWSSILMDCRHPAGQASIEELKANAYGGNDEDAVIAAGDRAPDAPCLLEGVKATTTSLFDIFDAAKHTVLVFVPGSDILDHFIAVQALCQRLPSDDVAQVVGIIQKESNTDVEDAMPYKVLLDTQGHARAGYGVVESKGVTFVAVRPDAYVGAVTRSVEELEAYFRKIFLM